MKLEWCRPLKGLGMVTRPGMAIKDRVGTSNVKAEKDTSEEESAGKGKNAYGIGSNMNTQERWIIRIAGENNYEER